MKQKREDNKSRILEMASQKLDLRDRWFGLRKLKRGYNPKPYARRSTAGGPIERKQRAQEAAKYLAKVQWGKNLNNKTKSLPRTKIGRKGVYNLGSFTLRSK